jgi:hypothetical protein
MNEAGYPSPPLFSLADFPSLDSSGGSPKVKDFVGVRGLWFWVCTCIMYASPQQSCKGNSLTCHCPILVFTLPQINVASQLGQEDQQTKMSPYNFCFGEDSSNEERESSSQLSAFASSAGCFCFSSLNWCTYKYLFSYLILNRKTIYLFSPDRLNVTTLCSYTVLT